MLNPPNTVVRNTELPFFLEVEPGKHYCGHRQQKEQDSDKASLAFPVHGI
jgi:hypothetical protein